MASSVLVQHPIHSSPVHMHIVPDTIYIFVLTHMPQLLPLWLSICVFVSVRAVRADG